MRITDTTLAVWSEFGLTTAAEEWIVDALAECIEAAALDFKARARETWPELASRSWFYVTVDGERVEPHTPPTGCTRPSYASAPTIDVEAF